MESYDYRKELLRFRSESDINFMESYGITDLRELYLYYIGELSICHCSYELQCAVYDIDPEYYEKIVDNFFINKYKDKRVDKNFILLDEDWLYYFFS